MICSIGLRGEDIKMKEIKRCPVCNSNKIYTVNGKDLVTTCGKCNYVNKQKHLNYDN